MKKNKKGMQNLIYLILILLPTYLLRFEVFNIPFTVLEILILLLVILFFVKYKTKVSLGSYKYPLALFLSAGIISVIVSPDLAAAFGLFKAYIVEPMLFFIVFINVKPNFKKTIKALSIGGLFVALIAVFQYFTGYGIPAPWNVRGAEFRVTSVYEYPNALGLFLAPLIILALSYLLKFRKKSYLLITFVFFGLAAVLFSQTEGAYIAIAGAIFFLAMFSRRYKYLFIVALFITLLIIMFIPGLREIVLFQDTSGDVRLAVWQGTVSLLQHHPLTGAGLAGFPELYEQYKLNRHVELLLYPHQIMFNFWVELGLLGLIWLFWVLIKFFRTGLKKLDRDRLILMSVMVGVLIYGLVDVPYFKNDLAILFWTWLGLMECFDS